MNKTLIIGALCLTACANQSTPALKAETTASEPTVRQQFPMRVRWEERALTDTSATIVAHVERMNALKIPFLLQVQVPAGVKVEHGRTKLELLPNTEAVETVEEYVLTFSTPPTENAVLMVDGDTRGMGFHGKVEYRFGRPAPEEPRVNATGPSPVGKGGQPLGPSVPLSP